MLRNKTVIESWNILKYEIESIIELLHSKKHGTQSVKKHLSREATTNIAHKQSSVRFTRKDEYYITSVRYLPEKILVHYQFQMLNFRRLNLYYLEQLIVPPEMVAKKIKAMKDNKLHGMNGS